jgi:hypothetical protein
MGPSFRETMGRLWRLSALTQPKERQSVTKLTRHAEKRTKTKRKGTKARARRATAGKTARGGGRSLPRSVNGWAEALTAKEQRTPGFWRQLVEKMKGGTSEYRAAQVEPRPNGH